MRSLFIIVLASSIFIMACSNSTKEKELIVYASVDQNYSEPIIQKFAQKTKIKVLPVYDVEAAKTTGLVNRLVAEKPRPQADVFWNGEFAQTLLLKDKGVLAPYMSPSAKDLPAEYKDPEGYWNGFAGRARVLLVNTRGLTPSQCPVSLFDLLNAALPAQQMGLAYPLFGTTLTHAAALYAYLGPQEGKAFFEKIKERGLRIAAGNGAVRDLVVQGQLLIGLTDTDDACGAVRRGAEVAAVFPDQEGMGTLIIPNTVALVAGGPHPQEGQAFIDFLLSPEVEKMMLASGWCQVPARPVDAQPVCFKGTSIKGMNLTLQQIYQQLPLVQKDMRELFVR
ncbi:MAG: extracellular solute-binding protein [Desulfobacca sp.]|nr:extracellular solute-binding protein [Desulfobacca sp.]